MYYNGMHPVLKVICYGFVVVYLDVSLIQSALHHVVCCFWLVTRCRSNVFDEYIASLESV